MEPLLPPLMEPCGCSRSQRNLTNESRNIHAEYRLRAKDATARFHALESECYDWMAFGVGLSLGIVIWLANRNVPGEVSRISLLLCIFVVAMIAAGLRKEILPHRYQTRWLARHLARQFHGETPHLDFWLAAHPMQAFLPIPCMRCPADRNGARNWRRSATTETWILAREGLQAPEPTATAAVVAATSGMINKAR